MAISAPRARPLASARISRRLLLIGLAAAVGLGGAYVAIEGNPLANKQQPVAFTTAPVTQGMLQLRVSAAGPLTNPQSVQEDEANGNDDDR